MMLMMINYYWHNIVNMKSQGTCSHFKVPLYVAKLVKVQLHKPKLSLASKVKLLLIIKISGVQRM